MQETRSKRQEKIGKERFDFFASWLLCERKKKEPRNAAGQAGKYCEFRSLFGSPTLYLVPGTLYNSLLGLPAAVGTSLIFPTFLVELALKFGQ